MDQIQTYCEQCGTTFSARYDSLRQCLMLECERCEYSNLTLTVQEMKTLTFDQIRTIQRLLERTAERKGETIPPLAFAVTETQAQDAPTMQPLDFTTLMQSLKPVEDMLKEMVDAVCRVCGISPSEMGKPPIPLVNVPMPSFSLEALERLANAPLMALPITNQLAGLSEEEMERRLALLRRCRQGTKIAES